MQRTIRIKLRPTPTQRGILLETAGQFTAVFNEVCQTGWNAREKNGVTLHHLTYRRLKDELPALVSDLHIQARVKATETLRSALARLRKGHKVSCPRSRLCPPRFNIKTFKIDWGDRTAHLSTTQGRQTLSFYLPRAIGPTPVGAVRTADLIHRDGSWWLHVCVELPTPEVAPCDHIVGVDFGVCRPAVTSDARFYGQRRWRDIEARIFRQKRQCQSKGTKSAKRRLRILRGKQARFRRDCDHVISRRIVDATTPGGTIVLENLTDIRDRMKGRKRERRRFHGWSFAQLGMFVTYKAEERGICVVGIDPRHTSQTCSCCGHKHRSNRRSQSLFKCRECGFALNADLNAARNIRAKHLVSLGTSLADRPPSTGPTALAG